MNQDIELKVILQAIMEKSQALLQRFTQEPAQLFKLLERWLDSSEDYLDLLSVVGSNLQPLQQMIAAYCQDAMELWQAQLRHGLAGTVMPINDKRFSADEWVHNLFFNMLTQHYLLAREHIHSWLEHLNCADKALLRRVQFFTRQYLDALSPDNFLQTNPQLMAITLQSHGKNLLLGLQNLLTDFAAGNARLVITMTDKSAFKVGENLATTAGKVIFSNALMELIQYTPQTSAVSAVPLLIIPPWINKYYILDLSANNSLIGWLVAQGITVFVISWANPDHTFAHKGLEDYLLAGAMTAVQVIQQQLQVKQVNTLGFCIGGTLLSMLLAYQQQLKLTAIRSATFLATMIDFSDPGDIAVFVDEQQIAKVETRMQKNGYLEGEWMASAFNSLRASDLIWAFFIRNYLHGKPPPPFDMLFWNMDTTNMPARMHSQYLRWMYLHNDLIKPGKIVINNVPLDVNMIDVPAFFVSTKKDHIAPWQTTYEGFQRMRGPKRFLLGGSGHIAGIIIPPGSEKYGYYLNDSAASTADAWLAQAQYHSGSWWPVWLAWLQQRSGELIPAPHWANLPLQGLCAAPGNYVYQASQCQVLRPESHSAPAALANH